jgi:hypothetical protein
VFIIGQLISLCGELFYTMSGGMKRRRRKDEEAKP